MAEGIPALRPCPWIVFRPYPWHACQPLDRDPRQTASVDDIRRNDFQTAPPRAPKQGSLAREKPPLSQEDAENTSATSVPKYTRSRAMLPPNTVTWNLLKRRTLGDGCGVLPTPQETTFPDYELISTTSEAFSRASKNQKSARSRTSCSVTQVRGASLVASLLEPARSRSKSCNTAKVRISTQYPITQIESSRVSLTGRRCLGSVILFRVQSLLRPSSEIQQHSNSLSLFRSALPQHNFGGLKENGKVQSQRKMFDVEEIVLKLRFCLFDATAVLILHLGPAGNSRANRIAQGVKWSFSLEHPAEYCALGTGPDKTHLPPQHIHSLREFVQAQFANDAAHPGDALIAICRPLRTILLGVVIHGAKLQDLERASAQSDALLPEENGAARLQPNRQCHNSHDWQR